MGFSEVSEIAGKSPLGEIGDSGLVDFTGIRQIGTGFGRGYESAGLPPSAK